MALRDLFETGDYTSALSRVGIEEDHPYVDAVSGCADLIVNGDYTPAVRRQFGIEEDHPVVGAVLAPATESSLHRRISTRPARTRPRSTGVVSARRSAPRSSPSGATISSVSLACRPVRGHEVVDDTDVDAR
ncbi:hypothetical protein GS532_17725 [Rhodococcus hoagii]|nr:hypothetical protein [Prescottella equi]